MAYAYISPTRYAIASPKAVAETRLTRQGKPFPSPVVLIILALSMLLWHVPAAGLDLRYYHQQAWSTDQGLPQDTVRQILQTADGFIWIGTEDGLARYDGANFTTFNHLNESAFPSDDICCLAQDKAGDLWIGTSDGLVRWRAGHFEAAEDAKASIQGLALTSQGSLVVLTTQGLLEHKDDKFQPVPKAPPGIEALETRSDGGLWLLADGHVFSMQAGVVTPLVIDEAPPARIKGVREGSNRSYWTYTNTAVHFQQGNLSRDWTIGRDLPGSRVASLFVDRNGLGWVGTNDGVTVLDYRSKQAIRTGFLHGDTVLQTIQDVEGSYWIGTENSGLHLLRSLKFRALLNNVAVRALVQASDGAVWVGTREDGVRRVDPAENVSEPVPPVRSTSPVILSLAAGIKGSVWVGTPDGLNHVSPEGKVQKITSGEGLPDDYVQALAGGTDGSAWIGTRHGLVHLQGDKLDVFSKAEGLAGDLIGTLLLTRSGELWMGTSGGLTRRLLNGKFVNYGTHQGLGRGLVSALAEDKDGSVWIMTTSGGLSRFASGILQPVRGNVFRGQVQGLAADGEGNLWSRDLRGIERVPISELVHCTAVNEYCTPHTSTYGQGEGVPSDEMVSGGSPSIVPLANGEVWSVTRRGIAITDPGHMPFNKLPPPVAIESFRVDDITADTAGDLTRVRYGHTRYTFDFAALSFVVPSAVHYRLKLEGLDSKWIDAEGRRSATYTNLPPRRYRFRVQAGNNDGIWNDVGATLPFEVIPPFYRRLWFLALTIFLSAILVTALYRLRLRVLRRQFDLVLTERNRLAREIHDTLAQDFVGISLQLDIVSQLLGGQKVEAAATQVQQTRRLVTDGLAEARQSIWELRANTTQDSLPGRLRKIVQRYASDAVPVHTKIGGAYRALDGSLEGEVLRIAQEALSNVHRHSGATMASVDLHYGSDMLVLTITDNGQGFVPEVAAAAEGHFGLSGMQERAGLLGAALDIISRTGEGTTIRLTMKIDNGKSKTTWKPESK